MTFALWTILAAGILPILCAGASKAGDPTFDNARTREWETRLTGWRLRMNWAQRNHLEAFPLFAASVLTAQFVHAPQGRIDMWAGAFILFRLAYTAAYVADRATLRSMCFGLGFACIVALFMAGL